MLRGFEGGRLPPSAHRRVARGEGGGGAALAVPDVPSAWVCVLECVSARAPACVWAARLPFQTSRTSATPDCPEAVAAAPGRQGGHRRRNLSTRRAPVSRQPATARRRPPVSAPPCSFLLSTTVLPIPETSLPFLRTLVAATWPAATCSFGSAVGSTLSHPGRGPPEESHNREPRTFLVGSAWKAWRPRSASTGRGRPAPRRGRRDVPRPPAAAGAASAVAAPPGASERGSGSPADW
eukprot:scaffold5910_cov103-Isochrysis_galbana.AAC.2